MLFKHNQILADLAVLLNLRALGLGLAFATAIALARLLGPEGYGEYAFAMAIFLIIEPIAGGGLSTLATRELADAGKTAETKRNQITELLAVAVLLSLLVCALLAVTMGALGLVEGSVALLLLLVVPGAIVFQTACGSLVGQHLVKTSQFLSQIGKPALFLVLLLAAYLLPNVSLGSNMALALMGISGWLAMFAALRLAPVSPAATGFRMPEFGRVVGLLKISFPFALITALQYLQTRIDVIFIGWLMDDADVGYYQVATRAAQLASLPASLLAVMMSPRFSQQFKSEDRGGLRRSFWKSSGLAVGAGLVAFAVLWIFAEPLIVGLFGPSYEPSLEPFAILLAAQFLFSAIALPAALLSMTERQTSLVTTLLVTSSMNAAGNAVLIPTYGLMGAAAATSVVGLATLAWVLFLVWKSGLVTRR